MNYIKEETLKIDDNTEIIIKTNKTIYKVEIRMVQRLFKAQKELINKFMYQVNNNSLRGLFSLVDDDCLMYNVVCQKEKTYDKFENNVNSAIASLVSFVRMLEVEINGG